MIIKKIIIENFLCYYSRNEFELSRGTNLIIGHNGSGKTKFLEALDWFFKTNEKNSINGDHLLSEKARHRASQTPNEKIHVSVTVEFVTTNQPVELTHSFTKLLTFQTDSSGKCSTNGEIQFSALYSTPQGERTKLSGNVATKQLDLLFPAANRKFCLFKGETELNVLKEAEAFKQLIDLYASSKHYEPYEESSAFFLKEMEEKISKETKKNERHRKEYEKLEIELKSIGNEIKTLQYASEKYHEDEINIVFKKAELEKFVKNYEHFNQLEIRKAKLLTEKQHIISQRETNFLQYLFDKKWILKGFSPIEESYISKIKTFEKESRQQQSLFDQALGQKKGEKKALLELINGATPLRMNVPSQSIMQEMLDEELCKFCNRPAHVGSEAYQFIQNRLQASLDKLHETDDINNPLYVYHTVSELDNYANILETHRSKTYNIEQEIQAVIEHNAAQHNKIQTIDFDLKQIDQEINNLLVETGKTDTKLTTIHKEYKEYEAALTQFRVDEKTRQERLKFLTEQYAQLEREKNKKDLTADKNDFITTREILSTLHQVMSTTKYRVYTEFIHTLQEKANHYFHKMNEGFFTGSIAITRANNGATRIELMQNGQTFISPNSSLETAMHLAVLFAINELTRQESRMSYPLVFDAPASTFDVNKRTHFYNTLQDCSEQVILLTKDFIASNGSGVSDEFKNIKCSHGYMIELHEGFSSENLSTVSTNIISL